MKQRFKSKWKRFLHGLLDTLLFVVPILEVSEVLAIIPSEYLPLYMLGTLILRRLVRVFEEYMEERYAKPMVSDKEQ